MGADAFAHSLYERLGCAATSQPHEIRAAYLDAVASKLHPDQGACREVLGSMGPSANEQIAFALT